MPDSFPIQLECRGWRNTTFRFQVTLDPIALAVLVEDALAGLRIYELMMIRRPGDILKYLWVRFDEVPDRVIERRQSRFIRLPEYQRWPEGMIPFEEFSGMFFWAGDDTEEEDECWLGYRASETFCHFTESTFATVRQIQEELRAAGNVLTCHELGMIDQLTHPLDFNARPPCDLTKIGYVSKAKPQLSPAYYGVLAAVLDEEPLQKIAFRGRGDFQTLRWLCAAQRRRANAIGGLPREAMQIHTLMYFVDVSHWGCEVAFFDEGIGPGPFDLWIEHERMGGYSLAKMVETGHHRPRVFLAIGDQGELPGYARTLGDGYCLYRRLA